MLCYIRNQRFNLFLTTGGRGMYCDTQETIVIVHLNSIFGFLKDFYKNKVMR